MEMEALPGTASGKRLIAPTRPAADASNPPGRSEPVPSHDYPAPGALRRCWPWVEVSAAMHGPNLERVSHHEAGHVVLLEWLGVSAEATATPTSGRCTWPLNTIDLQEPSADDSGELLATAAALFHAGIAAELLFLGIPWTGPMFYPRQEDYQLADEFLATKFGKHASGPHAFAQRVALHVLSGRWSRVREVADRLICASRWTPG